MSRNSDLLSVTLSRRYYGTGAEAIVDKHTNHATVEAALTVAKNEAMKLERGAARAEDDPIRFHYSITPAHPSVGWTLTGWSQNLTRKGRDLGTYLWGSNRG